MADHASQAKAISGLLTQNEQQLYVELARRSNSMKLDPTLSGSYALPENDQLDSAINLAGLQAMGQQFFQRVNGQAFAIICGSGPADSMERQNLMNSFKLNEAAVCTALSGLLIAELGIAPLIASVVAAIIMNLFFKPALDQMCILWKSKLPAPAPTGG